VASRERKRAERRKRKARGANRMRAGYERAREKDQAAREALVPLREDERPLVVTVGAVISGALAASMLIGYAVGVEVNGERPEFVQVLAPALITGVMAWGMWRARYWAVLGFETILLFLICAAVFGLVLQAASVGQILANLLLLAIAGSFFYLMIKAMARIQMPHRLPKE
jgi:hypothetical protein